MSNKINIDELLKQELGNIAPEPPAGVWESVSNQVQLAQPASQAVNAAASATKTVLVSSKIIATTVVAVVTAVAGFVGYKVYNNNNTKPVEEARQVVAEVEKESQASVPAAPDLVTNAATGANHVSIIDVPKTIKEKKTALIKKGQVNNASAKEVAQPVFTNQPDKAIDLTDPLLVPDQQARTPNETATSKQNTDKEEYSLQPANANDEEQAQQFEAPFIPNVITPNIDGKNDEFEIALENEVLYDLKITDRRGNIVFESKDKNYRWQGVNIYTGKACEEGMYIYAFKYQLKGMKEAETKSGWINLRLSQRQ